ncbi:hypothetical protein FPZ43_11425 [Mucilaginibacter pallidiroseus]|uniref:Uncharacterized protein n=1 Tax=Mucilaginibacter pallidiroseus TaxID=2599295 RepID=A0A563UC09_9SPHI|nr:hypothetical protein [Mucilaginibacter pallidiroseus]TWR28874.1 hypothetical protein FPZ43_11425 [Mucilaginibacter pallidiroseus]
MNRSRKRALYLWAHYRRRNMIEYVAKEKIYEKEIVSILFNDNLGIFDLSTDNISLSICPDKFKLLLNTIQRVPYPAVPSGLAIPVHLRNLETIVSDCQYAIK